MPSGCWSLGRHCTIHVVVTSRDYLGICLNIEAREEVHKSGGGYEITQWDGVEPQRNATKTLWKFGGFITFQNAPQSRSSAIL